MDSPQHEVKPPRVSVIIPSWDGYRNGCVPRLLESVRAQTFTDYELHVIKGVSPQGKAINHGAALSRGKILLVLDDDSRLADETVFQRLVDTLDGEPKIGMAGASIVLAPEATAFQRRAARQFPRFNTPVVDVITDSDLACHGCCAIPSAVFRAVGQEREDIIRGLDPDLRVRLRASGYRVVLVPGARIFHPLPNGWRQLLRQFFRNGYGSAYAWKFQRESVYETHEELHDQTFVAKTSLPYRILRYPLRLLKALFTGQTMRFGAYGAYAFGYVWGSRAQRNPPLPAGRNAKSALKRAVKSTLRLAAPLCRIRRPCARILTYHNIGYSRHDMNVTPEQFREQMAWLQASHRVIALEDCLRMPEGVVITFDDGYQDNLLNAAPVLHALGLPATVFMVAGKAGAPLRLDEAPELCRVMDWDELKRIEDMGLCVGSHTMTHRRLSALDLRAQRAEISDSKSLLEEKLGHAVDTFAYPYGSSMDYTEDTSRFVEEAGYHLAVSNRYGVATPGVDRWTLKRIWVDHTDTLRSFQAKVNGDLDALRFLDSPLGIQGRRILNHVTGRS